MILRAPSSWQTITADLALILFIVTFAVNAVARWVISRRKEFSGAN